MEEGNEKNRKRFQYEREQMLASYIIFQHRHIFQCQQVVKKKITALERRRNNQKRKRANVLMLGVLTYERPRDSLGKGQPQFCVLYLSPQRGILLGDDSTCRNSILEYKEQIWLCTEKAFLQLWN